MDTTGRYAKPLPIVQTATVPRLRTSDQCMQIELCQEALRLIGIVLDHPCGKTPANHALAALLCLHAARMPGRVSSSGGLIPLMDQNRKLWDRKLIAEGLRLIELSAEGTDLTAWHLEAAIAAIHASATSPEATDWLGVVSLYDSLMTIRPTPIVALNRAIAIGQCYGPESGIQAVGDIPDAPRLSRYPFYSAALGEFNRKTGNLAAAQLYFEKALQLAGNAMEADHFRQCLAKCYQLGWSCQ